MLPSLGPRLWRFVYCLALNYFSRGCLLRSLGCRAWDGCMQNVGGGRKISCLAIVALGGLGKVVLLLHIPVVKIRVLTFTHGSGVGAECLWRAWEAVREKCLSGTH